MVRKVFVAYFVYVVVVFFINTYILKENYSDAIIKSVISGVIFTTLYYIILVRAEKRRAEESNIPQKKKK
jgi:hypothetical protein